MKNQKGITLIALVITIIVLLILAGVSIAMLTGDNGILTKAVSAGEKSDEGAAKEAVRLTVAELITSNDGKMPETTADSLKTALEKTNNDLVYKTTDKNTEAKDVVEVVVQKSEDAKTPIATYYVNIKSGKIGTTAGAVKTAEE